MTRRLNGAKRRDWKGERVFVASRLTPSLYWELKEEADRKGLSLNDLIVLYLRRCLEDR